MITAYPLARSVTAVSGGANGRFAQSFIETSAQSWAEADLTALASGARVAMDEKPATSRARSAWPPPSRPTRPSSPPRRHRPPAAPAEGAASATPADTPKVQTRVAVIGDSDFAANGFLGVSGNRDMFLNTVNWLAQQENLIAIRPREAEDRRVTLTAERQRLTLYLAVLGIPAAILALGVATWWRRR